MNDPNILVTGANGDIAEAICGILREAFPDAKIDGADASGTRPGEGLFDHMKSLPRADSADFVPALTQLSEQMSYSLVIPTVEAELWVLAHTAQENLLGIPLLMVQAPLLRCFLDKLETANWLSAQGLQPPHTVPFDKADDLKLPIIVKPRQGRGSRGIEVVRTDRHLEFVKTQMPSNAIAQEYVGDDDNEYTCAVIRLDGQTRTLALKRRLAGGRTVFAEEVSDRKIDDMVIGVAEACDLDGAINVQLRMTVAGPKIFEINPRFSSTVMMRHRLGFQDLVWAVTGRLGNYAPRPGRTVYRLSREMIFEP